MFYLLIEFMAHDKLSADSQVNKDSLVAKLGFSGALAGHFLLFIPQELAQSITADFLGTPAQNVSTDHVAGTVLEMANMLAGSTLSSYNHQALFDLQIPELITPRITQELTDACTDQIVIGVQTFKSCMVFQLVVH
jgi:CheY-specific phosphatase CheX